MILFIKNIYNEYLVNNAILKRKFQTKIVRFKNALNDNIYLRDVC